MFLNEEEFWNNVTKLFDRIDSLIKDLEMSIHDEHASKLKDASQAIADLQEQPNMIISAIAILKTQDFMEKALKRYEEDPDDIKKHIHILSDFQDFLRAFIEHVNSFKI